MRSRWEVLDMMGSAHDPSWRALGEREAGPEPRYDDDPAGHEARWRLWRAIRRDALPTQWEASARFRVFEEALGWRRRRGLR